MWRRLNTGLIKAQKETVGLATGARGIGKSGVPPQHLTFRDAGIDKKLSSRAQIFCGLRKSPDRGPISVPLTKLAYSVFEPLPDVGPPGRRFSGYDCSRQADVRIVPYPEVGGGTTRLCRLG